MQLLVVRHGVTDWNHSFRYQGWSDVPLNAEGREQAARLAERLRDTDFSAVFSSDLSRAVDTAREIARFHQTTLSFCPELRELNFGEWEGLTYDEILQRDPELLHAWLETPAAVAPPGGETLAEVAERVTSTVERSVRESETGPLLVVTHGGPIRALLCRSLAVCLRRHREFHVAPGSMSALDWGRSGATLTCLNDVSYLTEEKA